MQQFQLEVNIISQNVACNLAVKYSCRFNLLNWKLFSFRTDNEEEVGSKIPYKRIAVRVSIAVGFMLAARFYFGPPEKDYTIARASEYKSHLFVPVPCSDDYSQELEIFKGNLLPLT